ncbi:MAG: arginine decarboxylase [Chlamydiales bacterium 38-26]|nr:biosynthetic arginine decarboxylase [Chlamydiales bacterium]OJV10955.1 MAG: arginine decarboxylase [Chlamydiales bacterium 38-26]
MDDYSINRWGLGYFSFNDQGHVIVKPDRQGPGGDLFKLTEKIVEQGIETPVLIRFDGIIKDRMESIYRAFQSAISEFHYRNAYGMAFPVKVNPQRHVVETIQKIGRPYKLSLEVGSKPELIAVLTLENQPDALLLCNGYKDEEYISLALMARRLGKRTLIIIEQFYEINLVLMIAEKLGVDAEIGFRMKLSTKGTGRWESSSGDHAKFGLFPYEIVDGLKKLKEAGKSHWLKLLHFHMGSQITTIDSIKKALIEASRMYTEIYLLQPSLEFFDVGGGLAVDYAGLKNSSDSSMNYSIEEYARNVVNIIGSACVEASIPDPVLMTESGRALISPHSVLVTEVIDVTAPARVIVGNETFSHPLLDALKRMIETLNISNFRETYHDALEIKQNILEEFVCGKCNLQERALGEKLYWYLLNQIQSYYIKLSEKSEEFETLNQLLLETYFCNFSVFQSLPDAWAIGQLFPVIPIHRLNEVPFHRSMLADLSCDSDGKIETFIGEQEPQSFLFLHDYKSVPYYLGIFYVGAYQEIMGGMHNLFGDTNVVHAELDEKGDWKISRIVEGDTIEEVLRYVQYNAEQLLEQLHSRMEESINNGRLTRLESARIKKQFKEALESYTYLTI